MANMSHCRFENTLKDLSDCEENLFNDLEDGGYECEARKELIELCHEIANQVPLEEISDLPTKD